MSILPIIAGATICTLTGLGIGLMMGSVSKTHGCEECKKEEPWTKTWITRYGKLVQNWDGWTVLTTESGDQHEAPLGTITSQIMAERLAEAMNNQGKRFD